MTAGHDVTCQFGGSVHLNTSSNGEICFSPAFDVFLRSPFQCSPVFISLKSCGHFLLASEISVEL